MSLISTPKLDDSVSSFSFSPITHTQRVYVHFLQNLFSTENPLKLIFSENEDETDIIIRGENSVNAETVNRKPAILVHRSGFSFQPGGIGGSLKNKNFRTGEVIREAVLTGSFYVSVIARNDLFADDLAWYILEHIWLLKTLEGGELFQGTQNFTITPPSPPQGLIQGELTENVLVQIAFPVRILRMSSVTPADVRILQETTLRLRNSITQDTLLNVKLENEVTE